MSESTIQRAVMDYLRMIETSHKLYFFRAGSGMVQTQAGGMFRSGKPGVPDICLVRRMEKRGMDDSVFVYGQFIGLEIKTSTGRQSTAQKQTQTYIEAAGGKYYIIRSLTDIKTIFGR